MPIDLEDEANEIFDYIELDGESSPGEVKLSGHDRKINWDVKEGSGLSGATSTLKSVPLIEFTATFYLADAQEINDWQNFREVCMSSISGSKPKALRIYHPDLAVNKINSVVLASMGGPVHDGKGGQTIVVKFQEFKPPKPKGGSPGADPNKALNAELAALTKQYQATPWGHL